MVIPEVLILFSCILSIPTDDRARGSNRYPLAKLPWTVPPLLVHADWEIHGVCFLSYLFIFHFIKNGLLRSKEGVRKVIQNYNFTRTTQSLSRLFPTTFHYKMEDIELRESIFFIDDLADRERFVSTTCHRKLFNPLDRFPLCGFKSYLWAFMSKFWIIIRSNGAQRFSSTGPEVATLKKYLQNRWHCAGNIDKCRDESISRFIRRSGKAYLNCFLLAKNL